MVEALPMKKPILAFERRQNVGLARVTLTELVHPDELAALSHEFRDWAKAEEFSAQVLDLSGLTYLTSAAIGMLINMDAQLKARSRRLAIVIAKNSLTDEILGHTHLNQLVPIHYSLDEAIAALDQDEKT